MPIYWIDADFLLHSAFFDFFEILEDNKTIEKLVFASLCLSVCKCMFICLRVSVHVYVCRFMCFYKTFRKQVLARQQRDMRYKIVTFSRCFKNELIGLMFVSVRPSDIHLAL
jgi:hypothetical protein